MENKYYVYQQIDSDGVIVYVGKGSTGRAWDIKGRDKDHIQWMSEQLPFLNVVIVQANMIEREAFWLENDLIKKYNPKFNKSFSKYGEANPNYKHGNRTGVKRNPKFKPNGEPNPDYNPNLKSGNSSRPIVCTTNGLEYSSAKEAAIQLGLDPSGITKVLKGKNKQTMGFHFEYLTTNK
jgi:hypothetical protein